MNRTLALYVCTLGLASGMACGTDSRPLPFCYAGNIWTVSLAGGEPLEGGFATELSLPAYQQKLAM